MDEGKERFMASQRLDGIDPNDEAALHRKRRANVALTRNRAVDGGARIASSNFGRPWRQAMAPRARG